jgi:hypothetical protein
MVHGFEPEHVDHINRNTGDNRPDNLRASTLLENAQNRGPMACNKSGYIGVHPDRGKWVANFRRNHRRTIVGRYDTPEEAAAARELALPVA